MVLRDADRRKDEFLAMVAPELRNPLAPIRNAIELLDPSRSPSQQSFEAMRAVIGRRVKHLGVSSGFDHHLVKPVSAEEIQRVIFGRYPGGQR